ncbi:hypothetical protein G3480_09280 [Thiorhodococcus mannitoliphagus]|uniref:Uncharacterized protein n=1 Tax=Thiorhodococcus mannitoliphagus TaxID=329406 RepID=A0A6P1DR37_9GAMM|nr:hypothetical protein [Thiorhodococcus mannitoliphagus]NEX20498.1 hypothetical protein [Thiorhodococcus mannitoliphagus]
MGSYYVRETFFRPDQEAARESSSIPAGLCNRLQRLLRAADAACVFLPIRPMQYLAVVERDEIVFVDAQGGYAHQDGEGGRLIRLAWQPAVGRDSISAPVPCEMVYYFRGLREVQLRLLAEIGPALDRMLECQRDQGIQAWEGRVLPFRQPPGLR